MHSFYGTRLSENMAKTPEGYLICYDVNIARIGSQDYLGSELGTDDDVISVNRPADEVFKPSTVASFEGKPFTNEHPYKLLDVNDTAIYEKGHVQNVRVSDDKTYLVADIMVKDVQTIRDIENGKRELSAGYECDCIKDENGNWYQCNIIGNHVALVDKGRAGNKVRINDNEWKEQDHPRDKDGKFKPRGGSENSSELSSDDKRGIDIALTMYGQEYQKRGNEGTYKASQKLREKVKKGEKLSSEDIKSIKIALNSTNSEEAKKIVEKLKDKKTKNYEEYFNSTSTGMSMYDDVLNDKHYAETKSRFPKIVEMSPDEYIEICNKGFNKNYSKYGNSEYIKSKEDLIKTRTDKQLEKLKEKFGKVKFDMPMISYDTREDGDIEMSSQEGLHRALLAREMGIKKIPVAIFSTKRYNEDVSNDLLKENLDYITNEYTEINNNKEKKSMNDKNTVLGKLLKAFAKDAQPEEMVEAINAVKGEDEVPETSRIDEIEAKLAELSAKFEKLYEAEKKEEQGEMHALDELEKEITDGCKVEDEEKEEEKTEVKDEDAKNDPKLIEAISEKAQNDEDTTEEIKKEIADAKKVIAKIEDVATRKAVADSLAKIIRGKITSNFNYKKLMDASKQKTQTEDNKIDYNEAFRKIKENNFRK